MGGEHMANIINLPPVDPRIYFVVVVLVVLICLTLLGDLYKTMLVVSITTSTLVASLALIGIFNHGDLHRSKHTSADQDLTKQMVRSYAGTVGYRAGYRSHPVPRHVPLYKPTFA